MAGNSTRRNDICQMRGQPKHEVSERSWRPELGRELIIPTVQYKVILEVTLGGS
jgi:hypothetical protein